MNPALRNGLFQIHLWTGLTLGVVLALIGLSGSILVYDHELLMLGEKPVPRAEARGEALPLDTIVAAARGAVADKRAAATILFPETPGDAAVVRFQRAERGARGGPAIDVYVDPVSGRVLETRKAPFSPIIGFLHQFHGNLALGREGRQVVGWLGVAMLALGITGLILWWPKRGDWKGAFGVRKKARGYWFHRELHGALGIWSWIVFIIVSFSGVAIVFPETMRTIVSAGTAADIPQPAFDPRRGPSVEPVKSIKPLGADGAVDLVLSRHPDAAVRSISLPSRRGEAIRVMIGSPDKGPVSPAYVDPWQRTIVAMRNPPGGPLDSFMAWQRPLHAGSGWGGIWRALVFLSGLLPSVFVTTGLVMWLKKRRARVRSVPARILEGSDA